ncbi:MAG: TIGR02611 family protein [Actinomycetia bacterium]|nr:TIGR02611 family protein [Actinomycetes bacterium]
MTETRPSERDPDELDPEELDPRERMRARRYRKSDPRYRPEYDFRWRAKIRANPQSHFVYKWTIFVIGLLIVCVGLMMVPLPGPGWLVVILGLLLWSSEFDKAQGVLDFVRDKVRIWNAWVMRQHLFVRFLIGAATLLFVAVVLWTVTKYTGSVRFVPEPYQQWMRDTLRL